MRQHQTPTFDRLPNETSEHYDFRILLHEFKNSNAFCTSTPEFLHGPHAPRIKKILANHPEYAQEAWSLVAGIVIPGSINQTDLEAIRHAASEESE